MPRFIVSAGNHDRFFVPVSAAVPALGEGIPRLVDQESGRSVPCQLSPDGKSLSWLVENLATGQTREYALSMDGCCAAPGVALNQVENDRVEVLIGGKLFTAYYMGAQYPRPFLYPVIGPYGASVTRNYPMANVEGETQDHPHHRSLYSAYGDINGVDDWSEDEGHGKIVHTGFRGLEQGPVYAAIRTSSDWVRSTGEKLMSETRDVVVYATPSAGRMIDYDIQLTASEGEDVKFGDTKEGGILSVRVATSMDAERDGKIENSYGGVNERETWGKRASWCDYSGPVQGKWVGIAVFDHPGNLRYPTYWHVRNYGLMTANMFGLSHYFNDPNRRGDYTLPAGQTLHFRYRVYVHAGDARQGYVGAKYHDFITPPTVEVKE